MYGGQTMVSGRFIQICCKILIEMISQPLAYLNKNINDNLQLMCRMYMPILLLSLIPRGWFPLLKNQNEIRQFKNTASASVISHKQSCFGNDWEANVNLVCCLTHQIWQHSSKSQAAKCSFEFIHLDSKLMRYLIVSDDLLLPLTAKAISLSNKEWMFYLG